MSTITIAGKSYNVEPRYAEGHVITSNEASALNQTFFENLRNNFSSKAKDGGTQEDFDAYAASYQFGVRTGGGSRDPIESEAMDLARDSIRDAIKRSGKKVSDFTAKQISEAAEKLLAKPDKGAELRELARQRVEQMRSAATNEIDSDVMADLAAAAEAEPTPTEQVEAGPAEGAGEEAAPATGRRARS